MSQAFVLINCELGSEEKIIEELKTLSDVKSVQGTFGAYDIIVEIAVSYTHQTLTTNREV